MKKHFALSLSIVGVLSAVVGCGDDTATGTPTSTGGAGGSGTLAGSAGSNSTSGAGTTTGAGGRGGAAGAGGSGVVDGGGNDVAIGTNDASGGAFDDGAFPPNAAIGSCDPLNWITSASSSAMGNPPANAIDGLVATRWSTGIGQAAGEYYQIDFGGYVQLSQITLNNTGSLGDHPRGYDAVTSSDGMNFFTVIASGTQTDVPPTNNLVTLAFPARAVRYLRIQLNASSGSWWSIQEIVAACQIPTADGGFTTDKPSDDTLCGPGAPPPLDGGGAEAGGGLADSGANAFDRTRWTATASSTSTAPTDAILNAFDGNLATRWSNGAAQTGTEFFRLDLGSVGCVSQVRVVSSGTDFAAAYAITVSTDDVSYITVAKGTGSSLIQAVFRPRFARYVRINQVGASPSWWSIDELVVLP